MMIGDRIWTTIRRRPLVAIGIVAVVIIVIVLLTGNMR
jgi:DMSO/TMAO reductase YedYZ heme-binding membrane subunit